MILRKLLASTSVVLAGLFVLTSLGFAEIYYAKNDSVNVRQLASSNGAVLGQVNAGEKVFGLGLSGDWIKVKYGRNIGWIFGQFLKAGNTDTEQKKLPVKEEKSKTAYIVADSVNIRSGAGGDYRIVSTLDEGLKINVLSTEGKWTKISTQKGTEGWIASKYVASSYSPRARTSVSRGDSTPENVDLRTRITKYGQRFLGVGYWYGGTSPRGFDCSGFVKYVFDNFGIYLDRVAAGQASEGKWVARGNLRAGDLVFFDTDGGHNYINHVGIYIGNDSFVHASSGGGHVMISELSEGFYNRCYMTGRRVISE